MQKNIFSSVKADLPAGVVVFLVALPLCLGISLASGAPFYSGIIAGVVGGIIVGSISHSNVSVSGPAAGLAAAVLAAIHHLGSFPLLLTAIVIAGILQMVFALARLGGLASYFPASVIKAMLTSIGILIIAKQIPHALGYDKDEKGQLSELLPFGDMHEIFQPVQHINVGVFMICIISIIIMLSWERPIIKQKFKNIPGALIAVCVSVIISKILEKTGSSFAISADHKVSIQSVGNIHQLSTIFTYPDWQGLFNGKVLGTAIMIAIIASLETLLSIEAVDNLDPKRQVTNTNRELFAQGIGNTISGLIGGLPITSVIVRSSANINAGAHTKLSAIFHGVLLLFSVWLIPGLLNSIPLSSLAAILLLTGYKLCKLSIFKEVIQQGKYQYIPFFVTLLTILLIDLFALFPAVHGKGLLIGVVVGLFTAFISILHGNLKNAYSFHLEDHHQGDMIRIKLSEEVSFLNKASIRQTLADLPENSHVIIDAAQTQYIDVDVLMLIKEFRDIQSKHKHITCTLEHFKEKYQINHAYAISTGH